MENKMKANVFEKYGTPDILKIKEVEIPIPKNNEMLIQVHVAAFNYADPNILAGSPFMMRFFTGFPKPKHNILGMDVAGKVKSVGKDVKKFKPGDDVFGNLFSCRLGAFAEYVCIPENEAKLKPTNISFEDASTIPTSGVTALQGLMKKGQIQPGQKVLINGASGGVGTFAVQIAKAFGAEVTGVCSTKKMEMVSSIGADYVIDYTQADFTKYDTKYDFILDIAAYRALSDFKRILKPKGIYVLVGGSVSRITKANLFGPLYSKKDGIQMCSLGVTKTSMNDMEFLCELIKKGELKPVIDKRYSIDEVGEGLRYLGDGHTKGKLVMIIDHE